MATGRQILLDVAAKKIALRNYEAWRFDQGDPMTNSRTYQICQDNDDFKYRPRYIHRKDGTMSFVELIEGVACDKQSGLPKEYLYPSVYKYYMGASEDTLERLGREIEKKARVLKREMIDQYDRQKIAQEYRAEAELEAQQPAPPQMYIVGTAQVAHDIYQKGHGVQRLVEHVDFKLEYHSITLHDLEIAMDIRRRNNQFSNAYVFNIQYRIICETGND